MSALVKIDLDTANKFANLQREFLRHKEYGYTEIRDIKYLTSTFYASEIKVINPSHLNRDIYVGINPRKDKGKDSDSIEWVTCVVVDIDPVRPKGTGSTEEQLAQSILIGRKIQDVFAGRILVCSGSGCHVYIRIIPIRVEKDTADKLAI